MIVSSKSIAVTDESRTGGQTRLREVVRNLWDELSPGERSVCQYLISCQPEEILFPTAAELGEATGTSNATVVRTVRRLGYEGLPGLKREIALQFTAQVAPEERLRQRIELVGDDLPGIWHRVFDEARDQVEHCARTVEPAAFEAAVTLLASARTVHSYGVGASELAARHLALKLNRLGRAARYIGATGFCLADELLPLQHGDTVVIFAPGRVLPDFEALADRASAVGAAVVLATGDTDTSLAERADVVLACPFPPTGSTSEALPAIIVVDALRLALSAVDETRTVETSHLLTILREQLLGPDGTRTRST